MANDNHLSSVTLYNVTMLNNRYYNEFFELGQQKINFNFLELSLPDNDPVYTLKKVMEELDFTNLLAQYSNKGRNGFNPITKYAVLTYANMRGVRSVDRIVELCERDLAFIWLTQGEKPQRDAFYDFINHKLTGEILDDLNYQFLRRLKKEGLITLEALYIDGTKIEANANRYTFVWRGTLNYHLAGLLDTIDALYTKYNELLNENEYGQKDDLGNMRMFMYISNTTDMMKTNAKSCRSLQKMYFFSRKRKTTVMKLQSPVIWVLKIHLSNLVSLLEQNTK